jgi:hypothetical protein
MKRMNYFDHQFLRAKDFNDEQSYHQSRRYLHNRVLHTAGIAQGLQVRTADNRPSAVIVDSGIAIDILGREIVLANDKPLDLPNLTAGNSLYLYIEYAEQQTDQTNETGTTGFTRWTEEPVVASTDNKNQLTATQLFLARVGRTAEGVLEIDMAGRITAGLANDDLSVRAIRLKKDGVKENAWPRLSCSAANEASLGNGSLSIDDGRELFFRDNGQIRSLDDNHKIVFNRANNRLELRESGTISFYTGSPATERMTLLTNGNVGIGTTTNMDRPLSIKGTGGHLEWINFQDAKGNTKWHLNHAAGGLNLAETGVAEARLFIKPGGNVGIGTAGPAADLEVSRSAAKAQGGTLRITNPAGGAGTQSALEFATYTNPPGTPGARVLATDDGGFSAHLDLMTKTPGGTNNPLVSRLRISSDGKVDIGSSPSTTAPAFPPEVMNAAQKAVLATAAAATATAAGVQAIVALSGQTAATGPMNESVKMAATATQAAQAGKIAAANSATRESSVWAVKVAEIVTQAMAGGVDSGSASALSISGAANGVGNAAKQTMETANQSEIAGQSAERKEGDAALQAADDTSRLARGVADFVLAGMTAGIRAESLLQDANVSNLMKAARDRAGEAQRAGVEVTLAIKVAQLPLQNFKNFKPSEVLNGKLNVYGDHALGGNLLTLNGKIGIGTPDPSHRLHVNDITGIRQNRLYLSGGDGGSSFSYNAHRNAANSAWVFPDPARPAVTVEMDDASNKPRFEVYTTTPDAKTSWGRRFAIDGSTGVVTVDGSLIVSGDLTVKGKANIPGGGGSSASSPESLNVGPVAMPLAKGRLNISGDAAEFSFMRRTLTAMPAALAAGDRFVWYNPDGTARLFTPVKGDLLTVTPTGNVGIGTLTPGFALQVGDANTVGSSRLCVAGRGSTGNWRQWTLRTGDGDNQADIHKLRIRDEQAAVDRFIIDENGNVGIGTSPDPKVRLDVNGIANIWGGTRYAAINGFMAPGSLTIGNINANFGGGVDWNNNNPAALLLETLDNTEIAVHDSGRRLASLMYYEGGDVNRITIGRQMGPNWGAISTLALNGKVGIGTPTPAADLEISRTASKAVGGTVRITNSAGGAGSQAALEFATYIAPVGPPGARVVATDDGSFSAHLDFQTKNPGATNNPYTTRLRIDSGGGVSIAGTTGSSQNVDLSGHVQLREYGTNGTAYFQARDDGSNRTIGFTIRTQQASPSGTRNLWDSMVIDGVGNVAIRGSLTAGGGKGGYVVDKFVNNVGESLELGDVVVIGKNQTTQFYGMNDYIPIPEIEVTDASYDTRICGIVCEVHVDIQTGATQNVLPPPEAVEAPKGKTSKRKTKAEASEPPPATPDEPAELDKTIVGQGQVGLMVTLGAFAHCKVDADIAPIEVGDLLTTSPTKGHAQKVTDTSRAVGAIIGKALGSLKKGKGKVPIMVTLH